MSTPITHNQLAIASIINLVEMLHKIGKVFGKVSEEALNRDRKTLVLGLIRECIALYNYPDAVRAIRRQDGSILSRKVTHFELSKTPLAESNWHKLFTPEFLRVVDENMPVDDAFFHDTADQAGDPLGQYTDWSVWESAKKEYLAENTDNRRAKLLAEMVEAHLIAADALNDKWFRKYVRMLSNGCIIINYREFGSEEKLEAFGLFKNLLMKLQENASITEVAAFFDKTELATLNSTVKQSYRDAYSHWLASNTLRYVKPISLQKVEPTEDELKLLNLLGLDIAVLEKEADDFVRETLDCTTLIFWDAANLMETLH